jgi:hypothetical protein
VDDAGLFFHLLGALLFVAGIVLAGVCFEVERRRERPAEIALLLGLTRMGVVLVGGAVLLLGFGLWLVHLKHFGYDAGDDRHEKLLQWLPVGPTVRVTCWPSRRARDCSHTWRPSAARLVPMSSRWSWGFIPVACVSIWSACAPPV